MVPQSDLKGITTNDINGSYTPVEALRHMLAGKGLEVVENRDGVVVIGRADRSIVQPTGGEPREDIAVPGSRIERAGFDKTQPATVDVAAQVEKRGSDTDARGLGAHPPYASTERRAAGTN